MNKPVMPVSSLSLNLPKADGKGADASAVTCTQLTATDISISIHCQPSQRDSSTAGFARHQSAEISSLVPASGARIVCRGRRHLVRGAEPPPLLAGTTSDRVCPGRAPVGWSVLPCAVAPPARAGATCSRNGTRPSERETRL